MSGIRFTSIAAIQAVALIVSSRQWLDVDAVKKYPVYYDPKNEEESHNPKGSGYQPVGPYNWNEVVSGRIPIFIIELYMNVIFAAKVGYINVSSGV
jgi:hypothetical protein